MLEPTTRMPRWPVNGRFTGAPTPDRTKGSLRSRAKEVLAESTVDDDGREMSQAERIVRAVIERAATGHVEATKLLADLTEEKQEYGDWQVTIQYVHQQVNLQQPANDLVPPRSPHLSDATHNTD